MLSTQISGPSDSASLEYGNGFDKCGPLTYTVVDGSDNVINRLWLDMDFTQVINQADKVQITLLSEPDGVENSADLYLKAELVNYPTSEPALIPFRVTYRGCWFSSFRSTPIAPISVQVGQSALSLPYEFI